MDLKNVVRILDEEFYSSEVYEDWSRLFDRLFVKKSEVSFRAPLKTSGLVITNSTEVRTIYLAFAPSRYVLEEIHMKGIVNSLLVVIHPFDWNERKTSKGFTAFSEREYQLMEGMGISLYSMHTPIEQNRNDSVVSTAYALAKVLKIKVLEEFAPSTSDNGTFRGVIGKIGENRLDKFVKIINSTLDCQVKLQAHTQTVGKVAVVSGEGFVSELMQQAHEKGATTYITGVITPYNSEFSKTHFSAALRTARTLGLNVIGCSRYLSEKWALEQSIGYFGAICKSEFIEDKEARKLIV